MICAFEESIHQSADNDGCLLEKSNLKLLKNRIVKKSEHLCFLAFKNESSGCLIYNHNKRPELIFSINFKCG